MFSSQLSHMGCPYLHVRKVFEQLEQCVGREVRGKQAEVSECETVGLKNVRIRKQNRPSVEFSAC